jgi:hypothetical protein
VETAVAALLDPKAVAADLCLTFQRVGELVRGGALPCFKIGKYRRYTVEAVEQFKARLATGKLRLPSAPRTRPPAPLASARRRRIPTPHQIGEEP